jgi:hypothetical protein
MTRRKVPLACVSVAWYRRVVEDLGSNWLSFSGDYEDLVRAARELVKITHDARKVSPTLRPAYEKVGRINERLVRQYVAAGVVSPGERQGREVRFGFPQLLQLVVARHLIAVERWKLPQIASLMRTATASDLRRLLPSLAADLLGGTERDEPSPSDAVASTVHRMREARVAESLKESGTWLASAPAPLNTLVRDSVDAADFARDRERLQGAVDLDASEWLHFRLTPWTEVHVRADALSAWDDDLVDALAENLKNMLRHVAAERAKPRRGR